MTTPRFDESRTHVDRIVSLLILGAALIGLGNLIRKGDDSLADFD